MVMCHKQQISTQNLRVLKPPCYLGTHWGDIAVGLKMCAHCPNFAVRLTTPSKHVLSDPQIFSRNSFMWKEKKKKSRRQILVSVYFFKATKSWFYRSHMNFIPTQSPPEHRLGYRQRAVLLSNPLKLINTALVLIFIPPPPSLKKKPYSGIWNGICPPSLLCN